MPRFVGRAGRGRIGLEVLERLSSSPRVLHDVQRYEEIPTHPLGRGLLRAAVMLSDAVPEDDVYVGPGAIEGVWGVPPRSGIFPLARSGRSLLEVEDLRRFHPDQAVRPLRTVRGNRVRLAVHHVKGSHKGRPVLFWPNKIKPQVKDQVIMCIRRKARRGVLLALGQGGGFHRKPRRTPKSDMWC